MDIEMLLHELTNEEKAALVSGTDFMYTNPIPRLGIPSLCMADGPHGLRKQTGEGDNGVSTSEPATAFPTAAATASGWNPDNLYRMGRAIAEECKYYHIQTLLGPGINIKRNPLCGRNFEYFSEDPLLAGVMGAAEVLGVQDGGVGVSLKHFAMNNAENYRFMGNSIASENTIRSIYLKPFEYVVKYAKPGAVMCAYNQINGIYCSENKWLLTDMLRQEWGFDGVVMTDWGAIRDRVLALEAGLDLEMPGDTAICRKQILDSLQSGSLPIETLDNAVRNILSWVSKYVVQEAAQTEVDWEAHNDLSAEIAEDCAVLMKNNGVLPLDRQQKVCVMGDFFGNMRYQGSGSSMIHSTKITMPKDAFDSHHALYDSNPDICDVIVVFAGLTDEYESEGCDRENMRLPEDQLEMIDKACKTGKKVVVVLFGGAPVELPFNEKVEAILNMYLPGQNGGTAVYRLLFGEVNPSGCLAETWPMRYEDVPCAKEYSHHINEVYAEGGEVGYRYYEKHNIPVRYPFGHGLSYTTFEESEWTEKDGDFSMTVKNTGSRFGGHVVKLFLKGELRGFQKVYLKPGESVNVTVSPEPEDTRVFADTYAVPEEPKRLPIHTESRFSDLKQTFMGRILYNAVQSVAKKQMREAKKLPAGSERDNKIKGAMFLERVLDSNSLRTMSMSGGKNFPFNFAEGFADFSNGHLIKGAKKFLTPIKVPPLPKDTK